MNKITKSAMAAFAIGLVLITASAFTSHVGLLSSTVLTLFAGAFLYHNLKSNAELATQEDVGFLKELIVNNNLRNVRSASELQDEIDKLRTTVESVDARAKFAR